MYDSNFSVIVLKTPTGHGFLTNSKGSIMQFENELKGQYYLCRQFCSNILERETFYTDFNPRLISLNTLELRTFTFRNTTRTIECDEVGYGIETICRSEECMPYFYNRGYDPKVDKFVEHLERVPILRDIVEDD